MTNTETTLRPKPSGLALLLVWACAIFLVPAAAFAQSQNPPPAPVIAADSCDPKYYDSLSSRAWLEAQREVTQNQNYITKPDSVLEYTCFAQHMREIIKNDGTIFSGDGATSKFDGVSGVVNLKNALADLIVTPMAKFMKTNYNHNYLGGRSTEGPTEITNARDYLGKTDAYDCDVMNRVWMEAKCMDFLADENNDGFYTLAEYAASSTDHRTLPTQCASIQTQWQDNLNAATEDETKTPWVEETMTTNLIELSPANCVSSMPINTGMQVRTPNGDIYNEKVCAAPGCHYV